MTATYQLRERYRNSGLASFGGSIRRLHVYNVYDSVAVASSSSSGTDDEGSAAAEFDIGRYRDGNGNVLSRYPDAYIDEVGVWNKALTATDVANLYNNGTGIP